MTLAEAAERLRSLHSGAQPLVLPNAWDAATARAVVEAGFPVVATTSAGVSSALGWADGEATPPDEMFAAIARIARVVDVPVTADIESGYGLPPEDIVRRLVAAGAVGCNLEAGADCIFPIGVSDEGAIAALVDGIPGPINVIPGFRGAPGLARLRELGVRRISFAARLYNTAQTEHQRRLAKILAGEEF